MEPTAKSLRQHASHCRNLAHGTVDQRMRVILLTMASEFDGQANAIEASVLEAPE